MSLPVAVVVVAWNSAHELEECVHSALAQAPAEVWIVDNGSQDGTADLVRASFGGEPRVRLVELTENHGFSRGCNVGIASSAAPYLLMLNADATLLPGYLQVLCATLEADPRLASASGKLVFDDAAGVRRIDSAGIELCAYALRPLDRGLGEVDRGQYDREVDVFGVSAAAALYRRAALADVGPQAFDEDLFAYYEDVDLAWRLRRRGWRHRYVPRAVALHRRRGADGKPRDIAARAFANRYLVWVKNESPWRFCLYAPVALPWEAMRVLRRALTRPALLTGLADALRRVPAMVRKR